MKASFARYALLCAGLAACSSLPQRPETLAACEALFAQSDARIARRDAADREAERIPGYDYLRVNRFLAALSPRAEVSDPAYAEWLEQLRKLDLSLRDLETQRSGADAQAQHAELDHCGSALAESDRATKPRRADLLAAAQVPDEYSAASRLLGLYPLAVPFMKLGIAGFHREVLADYAKPVQALNAPGPLMAWTPPPAPGVTTDETAAWIAQRDALGVPQLNAQQWERLFAAHAPVWQLETAEDYDRPGRIVVRQGQPAVDTRDPVVNVRHGFTVFRGQVLPQLVYVMWFSQRPAQRKLDPYAGWLDGVIWRVTLGKDGNPLVYDSIHACGCYHYFFPSSGLALRQPDSWWTESVLAPQGVAPPGPLALRLQSGTHYLRRVLPADATGAAHNTYRLLPYRELQLLPDGRGGQTSLFGPDGLAAGSQRGERWWLWPSGVVSPGTMRQYGRHATAFVGTRHFDDPGLLDSFFPSGR